MLLLLRLQRCAALMSVVASCFCCLGAAVAVAAGVGIFVFCFSLRLAPRLLTAPPGALEAQIMAKSSW